MNMIRRNFIRLLTLAGASSFPVANAAIKSGQLTVTYKVSGFSCVTCAVGLDVMMERQTGVAWSKSNYQEAKTTICYHPDLVNDDSLKNIIADMGFLAERLA
jgi:anaerobic selenocysteine-containing dehydrogenase